MKFNKYSWLAVLPMIFTACQDDMLVENQQQDKIYTLSAKIDGGEAKSRAQIQLGNSDSSQEFFLWNAGDSFDLYQNITDNWKESTFTIGSDYSESDSGNKTAVFSTTNPANANVGYIACYPANGEGVFVNHYLPDGIDFTGKEVEEVWKDYFRNNMVMMATGESLDIDNPTVEFKHLTSLARITYTNNTGSDQSISYFCLNGHEAEAFGTSYNHNILSGDAGGSTSDRCGLNVEGLTVANDDSVDLYLLFFPKEFIADGKLQVIIQHPSTGEGIIEKRTVDMDVATISDFNNGATGFEAGKRYWFNVTERIDEMVWTKNEITETQETVEILPDSTIVFKNEAFASVLVNQCGFASYNDVYASVSKADAEALTHLYINGGDVTVGRLDSELTYFPNLVDLHLENIGLSSVNLTGNTKLERLDCTINRLRELDLSQNTSLLYLKCGYNRITSLDLSHNTLLTEFYSTAAWGTSEFYNNYFATIDFSNNTQLRVVNLDYNCLITSLDVSMLTNLEELTIGSLPIETLDLSSNKQLKLLSCQSTDKLISLDLSNNTLLESIDYGFTNRALDLSCFPNLRKMYYYTDDANTSLDFSNNLNLVELCYQSPVHTTLDFSKHTNLTKLNCSNCANLTSLILGSLPQLTILECVNNKLLSLDVSGCSSLETLWCRENQLDSLDISKLTRLSPESWRVEIGNQKDMSSGNEDEYEYKSLTLTLTEAQTETWNSVWSGNDNNNNIILNTITETEE